MTVLSLMLGLFKEGRKIGSLEFLIEESFCFVQVSGYKIDTVTQAPAFLPGINPQDVTD